MEETITSADMSKFVETTPQSDGAEAAKEGAAVPGAKQEGSPAGSGRRQGEGEPSARVVVSPPLAEDGVRPEGAVEADAPAHAFAPRDAAAVRFAARSARAVDEAEALYASWAAEAKEMGKDYPGFDLAAVAKEPAFARLLRGGAGLRAAYEATHMDSVRETIRAAAAAEAEARTLDGVRLRGLRPDENGARGGGAVLTGGMAGLSREQRARIAERAMRGLL